MQGSWLGLLAAGILLLGQGTALHHEHEIAADCPAGPCIEHGAHAEPPPGDSASAADLCLFCELLAQGRASVAPAGPAFELASGAVEAPSGPGTALPPSPDRAGTRARAPPALS